ncbi:MAG: hypothetical protein J07HQX50_02439 [Haloquadratum sp. J07HQX50]|nr:MAG: hypothetical protein J07HQX50_02439 [Haloquadratum sp. J07HQX50]
MLVIVHTSGQILLDELLFEVTICDTTHQRFAQRIEIQTELADTHSITTQVLCICIGELLYHFNRSTPR